MSTEMKNLLLLLGGIVIALLLIIILFGSDSPATRLIKFFVEDNRTDVDENDEMPAKEVRNVQKQKATSETIIEMATLVRKCDDRLRIIEATGETKLVDEYYELEFLTRKGKKLKIECSQRAYEQMPFETEGSLSYKRNTLIKFKHYDGVIYN